MILLPLLHGYWISCVFPIELLTTPGSPLIYTPPSPPPPSSLTRFAEVVVHVEMFAAEALPNKKHMLT